MAAYVTGKAGGGEQTPGTRPVTHRHMSPLESRGFAQIGAAHKPSKAVLKPHAHAAKESKINVKDGKAPLYPCITPRRKHGLMQSLDWCPGVGWGEKEGSLSDSLKVRLRHGKERSLGWQSRGCSSDPWDSGTTVRS